MEGLIHGGDYFRNFTVIQKKPFNICLQVNIILRYSLLSRSRKMMSVLSCGISVQIIHSKDSVSLKKPSAKKKQFFVLIGTEKSFLCYPE